MVEAPKEVHTHSVNSILYAEIEAQMADVLLETHIAWFSS